jgi:cytochrome c553
MSKFRIVIALLALLLLQPLVARAADNKGTAFFEKKIRPLLVKHCYECHSEEAEERQGGLLLDRRSGWIEGGDTNKAVIPGEPAASLLIKAVRYSDENLQMPPEKKLKPEQIKLLEQWVRMGAPGPQDDRGETEFSRLGDQEFLFGQAQSHWAFQPVNAATPPAASRQGWNQNAIDPFVFGKLSEHQLSPSMGAEPRTLIRRLTYDLTGLPPSMDDVEQFVEAASQDRPAAIREAVDRLIDQPAFGEHLGRMWLDVARYADTDSAYRPDTRTPHYFPFAFTYRDYVVESFNNDKPFDDFVREQFAADLIGFKPGDAEMAALGFLAAGPFANRDPLESLDDLIDVTTRGLLGVTAACARCHDHKYEPVPTQDYYSLRGVFASLVRVNPLDEKKQPLVPGYEPSPADLADYEKKRAAIEAKVTKAGKSKAKNNNRSISQKIRETELAELLLFHPGAPARAMRVIDRPKPLEPVVFVRGDAGSPGEAVPRRFLKIIDADQIPFPDDSSGRLQLAERIVDPKNPLTARVFVNRVWGYLMGSYLVDTPSDFGLQGSAPTHPRLLDWLAADFMENDWSIKHLARTIVLSQTYQQRSDYREDAAGLDSQNRLLWRGHRKHLSIESIRDSLLSASRQLDPTPRGHAGRLWEEGYTRRRAIYGYINRFNLDPTLRAFDFPTPVQSQPKRGESIVAPQTLFTMNSPFVIDQTVAITETSEFREASTDEERVSTLFALIFQRAPATLEIERIRKFVELQSRFKTPVDLKRRASTWPLVAQSLMMSNEFQYID